MSTEITDKLLTASRRKLKIHAGGYSCAGEKVRNEDSFLVGSPDKPSRSTKGIVGLIADGVSHAKQAARASQFSTVEFSHNYYDSPKTWSTQRIISDSLNRINSQLFNKKNTEASSKQLTNKPQWLTTLSGIVFKSATAHLFHVGDSQIARIRNGEYQVLTTAHNQSLAGGRSILTRAIGADSHLQVDYQSFDLEVGDFFILTTDGVYELLESEDFVNASKAAENKLTQASQLLVNKASENGSRDNLSCLLMKVTDIPNLQPNEIRKLLLKKAIPPALKEGDRLEGYRIIRALHESSRSHLYLAEEESSGSYFTIKVPSVNFSEDEIYLQGFIREAWVGSQINHPAIMKVYPAKSDCKFLYHVCEYIQGQTLRQWMYDHPNPDFDSVRQIITQVASALRAFKKLDIVHRDIKPENIMMDQNGLIKLIDYGTASIAALDEQINRLTEDVPMGTVNYIAPETLANLSSDYRSDLFSLGIITYELLTGERPYPKNSNQHYHKNSDFSQWQYQSSLDFRSDIPFWMDLTLRRAVEPNPLNRYEHYSEFLTDLSKPNLTTEQSFNERPFIERDPVLFWKLTSAVLAIGLVLALLN